jgi:hypothetical protein
MALTLGWRKWDRPREPPGDGDGFDGAIVRRAGAVASLSLKVGLRDDFRELR